MILIFNFDPISAEGIQKHLHNSHYRLQIYPEVTSTNDLLKAQSDQPEGLVLIAESQTAGRGKPGRSFYSPANCGLYLSLLLHPKTDSQITWLTLAAAVAMAEAIEQNLPLEIRVKWVNDLYCGFRKVGGILTEALWENHKLQAVILGLGLNVYPAPLPLELQEIAGSLTPLPQADLRNRLIASFLERWTFYYKTKKEFWEPYCRRFWLLGQKIWLKEPQSPPQLVWLRQVSEQGELIIQTSDGTEKTLTAGEITFQTQEEQP